MVDVSLFTDEVIDLAKRTYDDIFQLIGVHGTAQRSTWIAFRDRFPWLLCNIAGGLLAAFIASRFEHLLQEVVVLSLFIPIVLALGESVSMQALTLTLQGLTDGPIVWSRLLSALWKEFRTATLLGIGCGAVVGAGGLRLARADCGGRRRSSWRSRCRWSSRACSAWRFPRCCARPRPIRESRPARSCWRRPTW